MCDDTEDMAGLLVGGFVAGLVDHDVGSIDNDGTSLGLSVGVTDVTTLSSTIGSKTSVRAMLAVTIGSNDTVGNVVGALVWYPA